MLIKPLAFLAFVALMVAYILYSGIGSSSLVRAGSIAPDFTLRNLEGKEVSLSDFPRQRGLSQLLENGL